MKKFQISLLWQVLIAIATGIALGQFLPVPVARIFVTFNGLFGNFLTFAIPLIIIGLIIPAISDLGKGAGRLLLVTAAIAYGSTVFSGFFTYFSGRAVFPELITESAHTAAIIDNPGNMALKPYFTVEMPAPLDIMTALLLSFCIGLGLSAVKGDTLRMAAADFRDIVSLLIAKVIIPLLPLHIFGIFLNMTVSGQVASIISVFVKIIVVIFILHILLLLVQFVLAGIIGRKNPLRLLKNMLPAYATALGTQTLPRLGGEHAGDAAILNLARHIVEADARGETSKQTAARVETSVWGLLDIDPDRFAAIREEAELNLAAYLSLFFPSQRP